VITVQSWSRRVALGSIGIITFSVASEQPIVRLEVDPWGDGLQAVTVVRGEDLRPVLALAFEPLVAGTFSVQMLAVDALGCEGTTGLRRELVVF
jgi:hypothetical protein